VPVHDPVPNPARAMKRRFWRIFRLLALMSIIIAAIAVILVGRDDTTLHINMLVATGMGIGFTVLLGTSLMTLAFLSADSGYDEIAAAQDFPMENE
jgi:hypothetical protein